MKTKSIYEILGKTYQEHHLDVVICKYPGVAYKTAKDAFKANDAIFKDTERSIYISNRDEVPFTVKFIEASINLESLRGCDIRNCYVEEDVPPQIKNQLHTTYRQNILNIIEKP
jgi:hypothetical protein